jgi:hypothetical protein
MKEFDGGYIAITRKPEYPFDSISDADPNALVENGHVCFPDLLRICR